MPLKVYNNLTQHKEEFNPVSPPEVKMYVCGVTVYDDCHIGHARAAVVFDLIYRVLLSKGYQVTFVRNFTDIDDKIIQRSRELKIPWHQVAATYIDAFRRDMGRLNLKTPTQEPKATEHIPEMIQLIQKLVEKGIAYEAEGDVFYSVSRFKGYGKLSHKKIEELEAGARVEVMEKKKNPLDFALWKKSKPGEPSWESPWGPGRPGWHIECSAMSLKFLGESLDIHGGGRDLIFPHHENEIAQSEGATGKPFVRYWLHNGFVNIHEEKMSKSTGHFRKLRDVLEHYSSEAVRYFLLSAHYRSPIDYSEQNMREAEEALDRFYATIDRFKKFSEGHLGGDEKEFHLLPKFEKAMDDDFNATQFLGDLFDWVRRLNKSLDKLEKQKKQVSSAFKKSVLSEIAQVSAVLGVLDKEPAQYLAAKKGRHISQSGLDASFVEKLIEDRKKARSAKNFAEADRIRQELEQKGIILKDNPDSSTEWHVKQ
ncbi:MAG: cysteine--tRNA ligase [Deltaproteobacteria bacterium]|nr:cysteine--tRNA ligase [Deltaproteobacteria bacterium]